MDALPVDHFLAQPRRDAFQSSVGAVDTTTLAAHDFDVDNRTGFMPPQPPPTALPAEWSAWEAVLSDAIQRGVQLAQKVGLTQTEAESSAEWRAAVQAVSVIMLSISYSLLTSVL